jgi:hypothetical protein
MSTANFTTKATAAIAIRCLNGRPVILDFWSDLMARWPDGLMA